MISAGFRVNEESDEGYSSTAGFYEAKKKKPHASMNLSEINKAADKQESSYQAPNLAEGVEEEKKEVAQSQLDKNHPNTVSFGASNNQESKER